MQELNDDIANLGGRYICFSLGKERFALPLLQVKEVIADIKTTPIPQTPAYFKGIVNLRGQVVSIIDLRSKLNIPGSKNITETVIIILDLNSFSIGVIVDTVDCVTTYDGANISLSLNNESTINSKFIMGVAKEEKAMTLILDLKAVLSSNDFKSVGRKNVA